MILNRNHRSQEIDKQSKVTGVPKREEVSTKCHSPAAAIVGRSKRGTTLNRAKDSGQRNGSDFNRRSRVGHAHRCLDTTCYWWAEATKDGTQYRSCRRYSDELPLHCIVATGGKCDMPLWNLQDDIIEIKNYLRKFHLNAPVGHSYVSEWIWERVHKRAKP